MWQAGALYRSDYDPCSQMLLEAVPHIGGDCSKGPCKEGAIGNTPCPTQWLLNNYQRAIAVIRHLTRMVNPMPKEQAWNPVAL